MIARNLPKNIASTGAPALVVEDVANAEPDDDFEGLDSVANAEPDDDFEGLDPVANSEPDDDFEGLDPAEDTIPLVTVALAGEGANLLASEGTAFAAVLQTE